MKQLLFLLLFPCLCVAQYTGNAGQKITLGEQTTADGLVYRGVLNDTALITPFSDTSAYIILDTVNNRFFHYKRNTNVWSVAGGSDTSLIAYVNTYGTQTVNGAKTFTSAVTATRFNPTGSTVTGTGMYAPTSQLCFSVTGTNRLTLDANGNMGLNFINPAAYGGFIIDYAGIGLHTNSSSGASGINLYENGSGRFSIRTLNGTAGLSFFDIFNNEERMRFTATRAIGIGESSPTAVLHLKAGTATASTAPLKFTSGVNLTTAEAGAMEFNGTNLLFTPSDRRHTVNHGLTGSATLNFPDTSANSYSDDTIAVTGAADGDVVSLGIPNDAMSAHNITYTAWVSAANIVTIRFANHHTANVNPVSALFKVFVTK